MRVARAKRDPLSMRGGSADFFVSGAVMAKKKHILTATLPDNYIKTIGPTAIEFTHYWRIVAHLGNGKTEVFWGHTKSLAEAKRKRNAAAEAGVSRGWVSHDFDIVELVRTDC